MRIVLGCAFSANLCDNGNEGDESEVIFKPVAVLTSSGAAVHLGADLSIFSFDPKSQPLLNPTFPP